MTALVFAYSITGTYHGWAFPLVPLSLRLQTDYFQYFLLYQKQTDSRKTSVCRANYRKTDYYFLKIFRLKFEDAVQSPSAVSVYKSVFCTSLCMSSLPALPVVPACYACLPVCSPISLSCFYVCFSLCSSLFCGATKITELTVVCKLPFVCHNQLYR
jgi:hypothetical protein